MGTPGFDWLDLVKQGGTYCAPLLLAAVFWLHQDRQRLLTELEKKDEKLEALAERVITLTTELRGFLFNERKA